MSADSDSRGSPERFPLRFREKPRWICWYWGERGTWARFDRATLKPIDGHLWHVDWQGEATLASKLPKCARTWRYASVDDPSTWGTFDEALARLRSGDADGLGYILDKGEVLLDIDGCMDGGEPNEFARACMYKLDSYAERSVSGEGIHVLLVAGGFEPDRGVKGARCEVYAGGHTNRYCTVTGDVLQGHEELNDEAEDVLSDLYETEFSDRPIISKEAQREAAELARELSLVKLDQDAEKVVAWACGHYKHARAMYARGDWTGWARDRVEYQPSKDHSRSEADAALASYLLAATEGDPKLALTLLHSSAMWRPKYDEIHDGRNPYIFMTVARACRSINVAEMRRRAVERRDRRLEAYPQRLSELAYLMRTDDVTDPMLRYVMSAHASGAARRDLRQRVEDYPQALVRWICDRWPRVVELAYSFDFEGVRHG